MPKCYNCGSNSNFNVTCPNCKTVFCIYCLRINMIHNDGQILCSKCNYDLHRYTNYTIDFNMKYIHCKVQDKIITIKPVEQYDCVICWDKFDEKDILRCNFCHKPYCYNCLRGVIRSNPGHICGMCRQKFSESLIRQCMNLEYKPAKKKQDFGSVRGSNEHPFDVNDTVIKCEYCKERFEYDTLISYFTSKRKYDKDYAPECMHCHTRWDDNHNYFMYNTFGRDFCKGVLNLYDPYACKYCQERNKFICCNICIDCMKQHFQINENTFFDCKKCHKVFSSEFMYNYFGIDYCKNVLKIEDPYECKICHIRQDYGLRLFTCKYCNTKICRICEKHHLENAENYECVNCHHLYNTTDLYDIFEDEYKYVQDKLHVDYPYECKLCKKDIRWYINHPKECIGYGDYKYMTCEHCEKHFCVECLFRHLKNILDNYEKNKTVSYIPEGFYKCPCCNNGFSNSLLFKNFNVNAHYSLYLIDPSKKCVHCNNPKYRLFYCDNCNNYNCLDCLCEEQKNNIRNHPEIKVYTHIQCTNCKCTLIEAYKLYDYLDNETCKNLLLETENERWYRERVKKCPYCGESNLKPSCTGEYMRCTCCRVVFNCITLEIQRTTNPLYYKWLRENSIK